MKRLKHKKSIAAVITILAVITVAAFFLVQGKDIIDDLIHEPGTPRYDYTGGIDMSQVEYMNTVYNDITHDYRPIYQNMSDEEYEWIFGELPEFKQDFFSIAKLVQEGKITDYGRVDECYWKQPEFYVGWFNSIDIYLDNNPDSWITEGYGCYPSIKEGTAKKGSTINADTYFRTGFATESYQGLIIRPYFPDTALNLLGGTIFEQPDNVEKYLTISITNPDDSIYNSFKDNIPEDNVKPSDWMTILKPTYRTITNEQGNYVQYKGFSSDWVRLLKLSVDIASDTPVGDYVIAIEIIPPGFFINQEYYLSNEHEYYGGLYILGGNIYKTLVPHFQLILHIE